MSIDEILTRGVENVYPNIEDVKKRLHTPQVIYFGIDPTAPTLHLGHISVLLKIRELQKQGHHIIILIGDFTAAIGDPDKIDVRKQLTHAEILKNLKLYKKQIGTLISFSGKNKAKLVFNSKWLSKLRFENILELASKMTVDQMLKRDMFKRRIEEGRPIYIHEFLYPLMQGYDAVYLEADGEIGGNDQTFNMLAGRTLSKEYLAKDKFVISLKLLTDPTGKKMGKSEGNMVSLLDTPQDMFGKIMSWPDAMIVSGFEICTTVPIEEVNHISRELEAGKNPKEAKLALAETIVSLLVGEKEAADARDQFQKTFSKGEIPEGIMTATVLKGASFVELLLELGLVSSKSEFRRLIEEGAVKNMKSGQILADPGTTITDSGTFKIGKRRFIDISVQ